MNKIIVRTKDGIKLEINLDEMLEDCRLSIAEDHKKLREKKKAKKQ